MRTLGAVRHRLALKGRFALGRARDALRAKVRAQRPTLALDQVQRRLDLLLTAMYGRSIPIRAADAKPADWVERVVRFMRRDPRARESTASVDNKAIHLPQTLNARDGIDVAIARYRLLAVEQAERLTRGTVVHAPSRDPLVRDLYLVREGMAVDARIARVLPGMGDTLVDERNAALRRRPKIDRLTQPQRDVERLLRDALSRRPGEFTESASDPADSLAWATRMATTIRERRAGYRSLPPAAVWGTVSEIPDAPELHPYGAPDNTAPPAQSQQEDFDNTRGTSGDRGIVFGDDRLQVMDDEAPETLPPGVSYDEWDWNAARYLRHAAVVRMYDAEDGDEHWSTDTLQRHAALVRQIRQRFERLRARRTLLGRQRAGDDLDIAACVRAIVDRRIGEPPDDRLYVDARPARRGVALTLLADASGSTEASVTDELRIIDLEKIALLLASEALDALGDLYAVYAFAGRGADNVKLTTIKDFAERNGDVLRRRVAGLNPGGFTRLGAAVRHATHRLARQSAGHRLLLILSDGRPNDIDRYQSPYGVEDSRQAIMEARASGVFPFCLTVDRDASEYLPRIFGTAGHTILQRPEQLPTALLGVVRALVRRP